MKRFFIQTISILLTSLTSLSIYSQSLNVQQGTKQETFLERLEIILQQNSDLNIYTPATIPRALAIQIAGLEDSSSGNPSVRLSLVDQQNLLSFLRNNAEYVSWDRDKKHTISRNWTSVFEENRENFFLNINPVGSARESYDIENKELLYHLSAGVSVRGLISKKFGFYGYVTRHAENPPLFVRKRVAEFNALPGAGGYETFAKGKGFNFWDARGGVNFTASRHFNAELAFDRNFVGNGYRSMVLSDYAYSYLYLKLNTYIWKFRYQHLYANLAQPFSAANTIQSWPYGKKAMFLHRISINATRWLNVGVFQSIITGAANRWNYINPVMFFPRTKGQKNNPAQKDITGIDFKGNLAGKAQVYGQIVFDRLNLKEATNGKKWWNNRHGFQLGARYIDAFDVSNFDLQGEVNVVRPYTYTSDDTIGSYTHYNQPLAHPLGANFREFIGMARYQPHKRIIINARAIYWNQGYDSIRSQNYGSNVLKANATRASEYGVTIGEGYKGSGINTLLEFSYEIAENIFFDAGALFRKIKFNGYEIPEVNTILLSVGIRVNTFRREYDF